MAEKKSGPKRIIRGLTLDGDKVPGCKTPWPLLNEMGKQVGQITSASWSPDFNANIAIGMVDKNYWDYGTILTAQLRGGNRTTKVGPLPFE